MNIEPFSMVKASDPHTYAIVGAAMAVHSALGCGFLERVYWRAGVEEVAKEPKEPKEAKGERRRSGLRRH